MANRVEYQIVGRYMRGKEVTGYHLQSISTGKSSKYTREQVCFLVGREQVTNCTGQIYNDKVLLRGKGMSLEDLPISQEPTEGKEESKEDAKNRQQAQKAMNQLQIVGALRSGKNVVGYMVQNAGCATKRLRRADVIELVKNGKISNARVQTYNGKVLLRGVNCNLDELPSESVDANGQAVNKENEEQKANASFPGKYREHLAAGVAEKIMESKEAEEQRNKTPFPGKYSKHMTTDVVNGIMESSELQKNMAMILRLYDRIKGFYNLEEYESYKGDQLVKENIVGENYSIRFFRTIKNNIIQMSISASNTGRVVADYSDSMNNLHDRVICQNSEELYKTGMRDITNMIGRNLNKSKDAQGA